MSAAVPAGGALAVDRHEFAAKVTEYSEKSSECNCNK